MSTRTAKAELYTRYPLSSILLYNGMTVLHYLLGALGIVLALGTPLAGYALGGLYLLFALLQMYLIMPLVVCRNCVYYRTEGAHCISGKNLLSRRIANEGRPEDFANRAQGLFCHNNLYLAALVLPLLVMLPALFVNFSFVLLVLSLAVFGLLLLRFFVVFTKVACVHCQAKYDCPNAERTGVRDM